MHGYILFRVTRGTPKENRSSHRVIVWARDRETAKRQAVSWLGGDPDTYEVEPITNLGDTVHLIVPLYV